MGRGIEQGASTPHMDGHAAANLHRDGQKSKVRPGMAARMRYRGGDKRVRR